VAYLCFDHFDIETRVQRMNSTQTVGFLDRRNPSVDHSSDSVERRQFAESRDALDPDVRELAAAIDAFKVARHRRYVTLAEVLDVIKELGYTK
jgi:hypothetical protein